MGGPGGAQRTAAGRAAERGSYDAQGRRSERTLTPLALSDLLFDADYAPLLRAGDARGVRAALRGDAAPPAAADRRPATIWPISRPAGVSPRPLRRLCEETPLPWDCRGPLSQREAQARARVGRARPGRAGAVRLRRRARRPDRPLPALARTPGASRRRAAGRIRRCRR
jgi:hypothetical protein